MLPFFASFPNSFVPALYVLACFSLAASPLHATIFCGRTVRADLGCLSIELDLASVTGAKEGIGIGV